MEILPEGRRVLLRDHVYTVTFSDTMVLFSKSDEEDDLRSMLVLFSEMYSQLLHLSVPFRGGLAHGRFLFNLEHEVFAGPALVEAYRLGEGAQWMGLVVDGVVAQRSRDYDLKAGIGAPVIVDWDVPWKGGATRRQPVINWPAVFRANLTVEPPITVELFYQAFEQLFGPFSALPESIRAKYDNTVGFINSMLVEVR